MSDVVAKPKKPAHIRGRDLRGNPIEELQTTPTQLSLFQDAFAPDASSTIELYDAMPKYFPSNQKMEELRRNNGGQFLDTLTHRFKHRDETYQLTIRPARIVTKEGQELEYYPTEREHLIEQALRKISLDPENGIYLGGDLGVQFTLSQLRRELERTSHSMNYRSLIDGLTVASDAKLSLATSDSRKNLVNASIFPVLMLTSRQDWHDDPNTKCYAKFHPLVTLSVEEFTYRQLNYETFMALDRSLARYLYKRMTHLFIQCDHTTPYRIALSTLLRDSGMTVAKQASDNMKQVERSLDDLQDKRVIHEWQSTVKRGPRNRIVDVVYALHPSWEFVDDIKKANLRRERTFARVQSEPPPPASSTQSRLPLPPRTTKKVGTGSLN